MEKNELNNKSKEELVDIIGKLNESISKLKEDVEFYRGWKDRECQKRVDTEEMLLATKKNIELYIRATAIK